MVYFGVGCFHFGVSELMPLQFSAQDYTNEIQDTLKRLSTVSHIDIDYEELGGPTKKQFSFQPDSIPDFSSGEGWFPQIDFLDLSFELYIPFRLQAELLKKEEQSLRTESERFSVKMKNGYEAPVAFVVPLDAKTSECRASEAVKLVRLYLNRELQTHGTTLAFQFTGPSPFHANFSVDLKDTTDHIDVELNTIKQFGYDDFVFTCNASHYVDENSAVQEVMYKIAPELTFYYALIHAHNFAYHEWESVGTKINTFFKSEQASGFWRKTKHITTHGRLLGDLVDTICSFRAEQISSRRPLDDGYRSIYARQGYLKEYIDAKYNNPPTFPVKEVSEIVKFRENRHNMFWGAVAVLISAILGGLVGGLTTYCITAVSPPKYHVFELDSAIPPVDRMLDKTVPPDITPQLNTNNPQPNAK